MRHSASEHAAAEASAEQFVSIAERYADRDVPAWQLLRRVAKDLADPLEQVYVLAAADRLDPRCERIMASRGLAATQALQPAARRPRARNRQHRSRRRTRRTAGTRGDPDPGEPEPARRPA